MKKNEGREQMMLKNRMNVPCGYRGWDVKRHRFVYRYPAVDCETGCVSCGWNPAVKERRLKRMFG